MAISFSTYKKTSTPVYNPDVPAAPDTTDLATRLNSLNETTNAVFDALISANDQQAAQALSDALGRYNRVGAELGVNAFSRTNAMKQLESTLQAAAAKTKNEILMQKAQAQSGILNQLANMRQQDFANAMTVHNAKFAQRNIMEDRASQLRSQVAAQNAFNLQGLRERSQLPAPSQSVQSSSAFMRERPITPVQQPDWARDKLEEMSAKAEMRSGLEQEATPQGLVGVQRTDPGFVNRTMGNFRFLQAGSKYLKRPLSNQPAVRS